MAFLAPVNKYKKLDDSIPVFKNTQTQYWADTILSGMTIEQKIGQLFIVTGSGHNLGEEYYRTIDTLIIDYGVGGVLFLKSTPSQVKDLIKRYNNFSKLPLLHAIDAEWGLAMRLDSTQSFPWMMTLGAIQDNKLIYEIGKEIGRQCKALGIHINFAPVVDINNNPQNPIIDRRSFGSDRMFVTSNSLSYMLGLQSNNILACAKHFPGHGDTEIDSHKGLPVLNYDRSRLDSLELFPFRKLINQGLGSVMIAHMNLPLIDTLNIPSSFSKKIIQDILIDDMSFQGLVITDALNMGALSNYSNAGERELNAFLAGNDILLCPSNVPQAMRSIKSAVSNDSTLLKQLNNSCRKILMLKRWTAHEDTVLTNNKLTTDYSLSLSREASAKAITVLKNDSSIIPINNIDDQKIAYLHMGNDEGDDFYNRLNSYFPISKYTFNSHRENGNMPVSQNLRSHVQLMKNLNQYDKVIIGIHYKNNTFWDKHIMLASDSLFLNQLIMKTSSIVAVFAHPYILNSINPQFSDGLILSYQNSYDAQDLTAQAILGGLSLSGRLPRLLDYFKEGDGLDTESLNNISFVSPFNVNMNNDSLLKIDSLVNYAISTHAIPGCQVIAARNGSIFYNKSFGFHTYDSINLVRDIDLYDIASVTKIAAAAPIFMTLNDNNKIKLHKKIKSYSSIYKNSDKKNLKLIDILTHQSRLHPWIPFYQSFQDAKGGLMNEVFSESFSDKYNLKVANNIFFNTIYLDSVIDMIINFPLREKKEYKYSDLGFYLMNPIVKQLLSQDIDEYLTINLYHKIGAYRLMYNPIEKVQLKNIIPTENDTYFRNQLVHGYVHDPGAALFGGVGLHAGLFSNGIDMVKLMQVFLDDGVFMKHRYFSQKTMDLFTSAPFINLDNRRGVVFDKPSIGNEEGPTCESVSLSSFGHSGFTGTYVWVDPEYDLIYIFLSNRVFPNADNYKLLNENIRTEVHEIIYNSIM